MRIIPLLVILTLIDYYVFKGVQSACSELPPTWSTGLSIAYWTLCGILLLAIIIYQMAGGRSLPAKHTRRVVGLSTMFIVPQLLIAFLLLLEDIWRFGRFAINKLLTMASFGDELFSTDRAPLYDQIALALGLFTFFGIVHGMTRGKYRFKTHRVTLSFPDLPDAFDGFTITQLSDIHSGSFDDRPEVQKGIEMANAQNSDLMVFTGDLVNNKATEMDHWIEAFAKLKAPFGKFSILGNHDYGDYVPWPSQEAKMQNLQDVKDLHPKIGFKLLLNESVTIEKDGQSIQLVGVENWGERGFTKHGDLKQAMSDVPNEAFKILLSHDPSHWNAQVIPYPSLIQLTLSGHTHGLQFGIELFGFKWSPIKYIYKHWAGLYEKAGQYLYVNRGFGFHGFPGRVGIHPEITVITLKKG